MARKLTAMLFYLLAFSVIVAQEPADSAYLTISGLVKDGSSKKVLDNASISVCGSNIGTVSNADGSFSLKIPKRYAGGKIRAEQLGYYSNTLPINDFLNNDGKGTFMLKSTAKMLKELVVLSGKAEEIVAEALKKVPDNYPSERNKFTAFYRETIQKGKRYVGVSEAVMEVLKTPYTHRINAGERVQVMKGRRLISQKSGDTLAVKIVGGPTVPVVIDFVKNGDLLFGADDLKYYEFSLEKPVSLDERLQYVIKFSPKVKLDYALCKGVLYIDQETLSFSKAEFCLDMSDKAKATNAILRKKPRGLNFKPQEVAFVVTYKLVDGVSYLNYIKTKARFKCDWKKRLFSSSYTANTEMVMVDRVDRPEEGISRKAAFGNDDIFYDKVGSYWDADFWRGYNIIEPTESLDKAVTKLKKNNAKAMAFR